MLYKKRFLSTAFLLLLLSGCCIGTRECMPPYFHFASLRVVRASDSTDLVFGPNSRYDKNKIVFYALRGNDTTFFPSKPVKVNQVGYDSVLEVDFFPASETAYMQLSTNDVDTMQLAFRTHQKTSCCNASSELATITYNNTVNLDVRNGVQELKK